MSQDVRSYREIVAAHPVPWMPVSVPGFHNGMALLKVIDSTGQEVPMFTLLRVIQLVTSAPQTATAPVPPAP
jgi:hypothetical protein